MASLQLQFLPPPPSPLSPPSTLFSVCLCAMWQSFDLCCILHMAINKRAEIQLNGIKSGIPVSPTTPTPPLPKHAPIYKCPCASISPHQQETVQTRPEQQPEMVMIHCPRPPHYCPHARSIELPLCEADWKLRIQDCGGDERTLQSHHVNKTQHLLHTN